MLHVNLVRIDGLQDRVIAKMVQIMNLPVHLDGATVPIRYAPPRDTPLELWDSGLPIRAEAGDTVRSIAQKYAVPVWAVTQLNDISASTPLAPGQRLVVPRHLEPMSPAFNPADDKLRAALTIRWWRLLRRQVSAQVEAYGNRETHRTA